MATSGPQKRLETLLGHLKGGQGQLQPQTVSGLHGTASPRRYRYTLDDRLLSTQDREFYEENGYLLVRGLVSEERLQQFKERFRDICQRKVKIPGLTVMKDVAIAKTEFAANEKAVTKIQDFQYDPILSQYCSLPEIIRYVECFTGPDIMAMHTMLINKPPDPGSKTSRHPLHQDLHYFPFRPADRIVCSWTAMEPVHRQNGCLVVLPGTHKGELLTHVYPKWEGGVNKMYYGIQEFDPSAPRVHVEMGPGDTLFFHPILVHGSGMNRTDGFRKAISCHYASGSLCDYIPVDGTTQQNIEQEVMEIAKKKLGLDTNISFQDTWKIRALHVQGDRVNL